MQLTSSTTTIPTETRVFLEDILAELDTSFSSPQHKERELQTMYHVFNDMLTKALIAALPADDVTEFEQLLSETNDNERAQAFLQEKIPDVDVVFQQVLAQFRSWAHTVHPSSNR